MILNVATFLRQKLRTAEPKWNWIRMNEWMGFWKVKEISTVLSAPLLFLFEIIRKVRGGSSYCFFSSFGSLKNIHLNTQRLNFFSTLTHILITLLLTLLSLLQVYKCIIAWAFSWHVTHCSPLLATSLSSLVATSCWRSRARATSLKLALADSARALLFQLDFPTILFPLWFLDHHNSILVRW